VEDEEDIRALARRFLEEAGYRVVEAENGAAGIVAFERNRNEVALIVTDVQMPELNGYAMASRIFGMAGRQLPVLYLSGYADNTTIPPGAMHVTTRFLGKPIKMRELVREAGCLLERHRSAAAGH